MKYLTILPIVITISGIFIHLNSINSKTNIGRTFLTDEQKLKVKYFNILKISFFFLLLVSDVSYIITKETTYAISLGIIAFFILFFITSPMLRLIENFLLKKHIKYKVNLEEVGEVFIIRMHDKDICLCSTNPNAEFLTDQSEYYLIPLQNILGKKFVKEVIIKPQQTILSKLFD